MNSQKQTNNNIVTSASAQAASSEQSSGESSLGWINNRADSITQRKQQAIINQGIGGNGLIAQLVSDVVENKDNATDTRTADKKIKSRNDGEKWYRFAKDGNKIDSFGNNLSTEDPAGSSPLSGNAIELSNDAQIKDENISELSRGRHFSAGDRLLGINKSARKGKWTWHHKQAAYKMELVDMAVHRSFGHHGGFSQWSEDLDDTSDD